MKDLATATPFQLPPINTKNIYTWLNFPKSEFSDAFLPPLPIVAHVCFDSSCISPRVCISPLSAFLPSCISLLSAFFPCLHFSPVTFLSCLHFSPGAFLLCQPILAPVCLVVAAFIPLLHFSPVAVFSVFQYFIQTMLKGIGLEAILLIRSPLPKNIYMIYQDNPDWGNTCQSRRQDTFVFPLLAK